MKCFLQFPLLAFFVFHFSGEVLFIYSNWTRMFTSSYEYVVQDSVNLSMDNSSSVTSFHHTATVQNSAFDFSIDYNTFESKCHVDKWISPDEPMLIDNSNNPLWFLFACECYRTLSNASAGAYVSSCSIDNTWNENYFSTCDQTTGISPSTEKSSYCSSDSIPSIVVYLVFFGILVKEGIILLVVLKLTCQLGGCYPLSTSKESAKETDRMRKLLWKIDFSPLAETSFGMFGVYLCLLYASPVYRTRAEFSKYQSLQFLIKPFCGGNSIVPLVKDSSSQNTQALKTIQVHKQTNTVMPDPSGPTLPIVPSVPSVPSSTQTISSAPSSTVPKLLLSLRHVRSDQFPFLVAANVFVPFYDILMKLITLIGSYWILQSLQHDERSLATPFVVVTSQVLIGTYYIWISCAIGIVLALSTLYRNCTVKYVVHPSKTSIPSSPAPSSSSSSPSPTRHTHRHSKSKPSSAV